MRTLDKRVSIQSEFTMNSSSNVILTWKTNETGENFRGQVAFIKGGNPTAFNPADLPPDTHSREITSYVAQCSYIMYYLLRQKQLT